MKKKVVASLITACLVLPSVFSFAGCGGAKIADLDWGNLFTYAVQAPSFTVYEIPNERALTYMTDDGLPEIKEGGYYTVGLSAYEGDSVETLTINQISAQYACNYRAAAETKGVQYMARRFNGEWIERVNGKYRSIMNTRREAYDGVELTNASFYMSIIDWARYNYAAFEKTGETDNTVTYTATGDALSTLTTECQTVFSSSTVSEMCVYFEKDVYSNEGVSQESSALYMVDAIAVKDQNGLLFVMKNVETAMLEVMHDMAFGFFYDESNFTLKGGEGVDYGEYYFTKDAVRVCTPNNPNADQKEFYLAADREKNTAKYIVKKQSGYDVQTITIEQFESRKQSLMDTFFSGMAKYGYGRFKQYEDCVNTDADGNYTLLWKAKEIHGAALGVAQTYKNVSLRFNHYYISENNKVIFKEGSFDLVLSAGEQSVIHHYKLTDGGTTTVTVPQV